MTEIDYYEQVRQKLVSGDIHAPKHKKVIKLMKIFWNEEEIKLLSHFDTVGNYISSKHLSEKSGIPKDQIKQILARSVENGTLARTGSRYSLKTILPGIFEKYFIIRKDSEENQLKAARLFRDIMKEVEPGLMYEITEKIFHPLLPYEAKEKLVKINESVDYKSQVLSYETVKQLIEDNEHFAVVPCQCRLIGELTGELCECAPAEMGCFMVGLAARALPEMTEHARVMTKEEAIQFLKDTEKAGLVHNASYGSEEQGMFICNCCSCHCGALYPARLMHYRGANPSNYKPNIDMDLCVKCETCMRMCPGDAIYHKWPHKTDSSDERMIVREDLCIGCGICAANCPKDAIKMIKVRDIFPEKAKKHGDFTIGDLIMS